MAYKPNYATGDLIDVTIWQELVNRAIYIFADSTARDNASTGITSQQKDNSAISWTQVQEVEGCNTTMAHLGQYISDS